MQKLVPPRIVFVLSLVCVAVQTTAQSYTLADLGLLPNTVTAYARGINESGEVCGFCRDTFQQPHAFVWSDGVLTELTAPGWSSIIAQDIDALGRTVGNAITPGGFHAYLSTPNGLRDLGTINNGAGDLSGAVAINARGEITGSDQPAAGPSRSFRWSNGRWTVEPNLPGGTYSVGQTINDGGVIGGIADKSGGLPQAVRWDAANAITDLLGTNGVTGGVRGSADQALCGQGQTRGSTLRQAYLWRLDGTATPLGTLPGGFSSDAYAVNNKDEVVGTALDASARIRAFVWTQAAGMQDLNNLIPAGTGWSLEFATAINDSGEIAGSGRLNGVPRAFLLRPMACLTQVRPLGMQLGQSMSFRVSSPCHAGLLGVVLVSGTGKAGTIPLPGGVSVQLDLDVFTTTLLAFPAVSVVPLDSAGVGSTVAFPAPSDPGLVGRPLWVAATVLDSAALAFVAAGPTTAFSLIP